MKVAPVLLGPANALAATGAPWRWVRDTAAALGVRSVGHGRKTFVPAGEFLEALAKSDATPEQTELPTADDLRARLGLRLIGGGR